MNEGQIYRAECIRKAIDDIEVVVNNLEHKKLIESDQYETIKKNVEIIKHHSLSLSYKADEWDRPEK
jgi:hypothetical protein